MRPILVLLLLLVPAIAAASHVPGCTPTTSRPEVDAAGHYVDIDWSPHGWTIWIYEESNGIPGLQRADEMVDDTCEHYALGDRIIF